TCREDKRCPPSPCKTSLLFPRGLGCLVSLIQFKQVGRRMGNLLCGDWGSSRTPAPPNTRHSDISVSWRNRCRLSTYEAHAGRLPWKCLWEVFPAACWCNGACRPRRRLCAVERIRLG